MKKNNKITLSAMMAALAVAFMLLSYFPYLTYAIPAIAGLFIMVIVIEINCKWAFAAFIASSILVLLSAEPESKLMYVLLLGYYPIIKAFTERINKPVIEWFIKIIVFNISVLAAYLIFAKLFGITLDDLMFVGKYGPLILLILGNIVFVFYDIAVSRMACMYINVLHPKIKKLLK